MIPPKPPNGPPPSAPPSANTAPADPLETYKKMVKLNPTMRPEGLNTEAAAGQLADQMRQARELAAAAKSAKAGGIANAQSASAAGAGAVADLASAMSSVEERFFSEQKALALQLAQLEAQDRELPVKVLDRVLQAMVTHDPALQSPKSAEIVRMEKEFLDAIGFSAQKLAAKRVAR